MLSTLALFALTTFALADEAPAGDAPTSGDSPDKPPEEGSTFTERHVSDGAKSGNVRHGVRVGYVYLNQAQAAGLREPHLFGLGWEGEFKMLGSDNIDFILVTNAMALGMNQGMFIPTGNLLVGAHIAQIFEVGTGVNVSLYPTASLHMIVAAAITPKMGKLQLPIAVSYVPDVDGFWKVGLTAGVNWGAR